MASFCRAWLEDQLIVEEDVPRCEALADRIRDAFGERVLESQTSLFVGPRGARALDVELGGGNRRTLSAIESLAKAEQVLQGDDGFHIIAQKRSVRFRFVFGENTKGLGEVISKGKQGNFSQRRF